MASLSLSNTEVKENIATVLGITRTIADWDTTLAADVDRVIRNGRRRFYSSNDWKFLRIHNPIVVPAPQETGTVTIASGVVTLAGATFPSDVVNNYLLSAGSGLYEIAVRDTSTQVTLRDTSATAAALSTYALYKHNHDLPANFGGFMGPVTLENDVRLQEAAVIPEFELRTFQNQQSVRTGRPRMFAVSHRLADTDLAVPTYYMTLWPLADALYVVEADIKITPGDTLDDTDSTENMHPMFAGCMIEAILAEAEIMMNNFEGVHNARYEQMLLEAITKDRVAYGVRRSIARGRNTLRDPLYDLRTGTSAWPGE